MDCIFCDSEIKSKTEVELSGLWSIICPECEKYRIFRTTFDMLPQRAKKDFTKENRLKVSEFISDYNKKNPKGPVIEIVLSNEEVKDPSSQYSFDQIVYPDNYK